MGTETHWRTRIRTALDTTGHLPDDDVVEELAHHARATHEAAVADGGSPEEADRHVDDLIARWREGAGALQRPPRRRAAPILDAPVAPSASFITGLWHDLRYAVRLLRRQPRHALITAMTMALGVGATTVVFSVTHGVLIKPLPWLPGDRLIQVQETRGGRPPRFMSFSNAALLAWRDEARQSTTIDGIAAWSQRQVTLFHAGESQRVLIAAASPQLFALLDARPLVGALFEPGDDGTSRVVVLSERLWRQQFGADRHVPGRSIQIDGVPHDIVGVLPDALAFPDRRTQAWVPFRIQPTTGNYLSMFHAVARLRPGVTAEQAAAEGTARGAQAADTGMTTMAIFGGGGPIGISARPLRDAFTGGVRRPLIVLLSAVGLLFLAAVANIAGLQLTRANARRREMAIRAALGAGRARVTRQLLVEGLLLGSMGAAGGIALAAALHRALPALLPPDFPRADGLAIDATVTGFALVVSIATGVLCGLVPAWGLRRVTLTGALREDGTAPVGAGGATRTGRSRLVIMAVQVAVASVLLVGALLVGRSFVALAGADRGFDPSNVMTARLAFPSALFPAERRYELVDDIITRLAQVTGVVSAAFTSDLPLSPGGSTASFHLSASRAGAEPAMVQVSPRIVSPRYFAALGMHPVTGRVFTDADVQGAEPVAVVNRSFARRYLDDDAVGAKVPMALGHGDSTALATIVGVVDDARYVLSAETSQPELFYSHRQLAGRLNLPVVTLLVRTTGPSDAIAPAIHAITRTADTKLKAEAVMPLEDRVIRTLAHPRLYATLFSGFAALALLVSAVGLFGVLSYSVGLRAREIAVRAALGARPRDLTWLVVRQGLGVTIAGLVAGLGVAAALARSLTALLYDIAPFDPVTFAAVPGVIVAVTILACWAPARRAARVDPVSLLR